MQGHHQNNTEKKIKLLKRDTTQTLNRQFNIILHY